MLRTKFDDGITSKVRGVFSYQVNDEGLMTNLRGYWNMDRMLFGTDVSLLLAGRGTVVVAGREASVRPSQPCSPSAAPAWWSTAATPALSSPPSPRSPTRGAAPSRIAGSAV